MKNILKYISFLLAAGVVLNACQKAEVLPYYASGTDIALQASSTTVKPAVADSLNKVLTLSWSSPHFATDSTTYKFVVEIAPTGTNFALPATYTVNGALSLSFTGNELNRILSAAGVPVNGAKDFDVRVKGSYANNNDLKLSNVVKINVTSFAVPIKLTASSTNALVLDVKNATSPAVGFTWNSSPYGATTVNYMLQIDQAGNNFAAPQKIKIDQGLSSSITVNDLNNAAIAAGVLGGSTKNLEFRIVSYTDANYTQQMVISNVVTINVTTFTPVPPALYIVGDATPGGWSNPVPVPSQQFTRIDAVSYGIVINLTAGKSYLLLPVNGDWSHKYGGASATGGTLLTDGAVPGSNTPAPATSGTYKIVVNFQTGTYTVTPVTVNIPANLYIVGDATDGGWSNPVPVPAQQFTRIDATTFGIITKLTTGGSYLFLPVNGDWSHKFGGASATGGTLLADGDVPGSNTPAPATTGMYQILVNFLTNTYTVTPFTGTLPVPQELYIVGDATPGGWNNPVPVPQQKFSRINLTDFQLRIDLTAGKSYLLLPVNGSWDHKYGGTGALSGDILVDGAVPGSNTPAPAVSGNYLIDVNFATGKYTLTKQ